MKSVCRAGRLQASLAWVWVPWNRPWPGELAAAQSQEAAGLLPAHAHSIQIVVKEGHEPLLHIGVDLICLPQDIKGEAAAQNTDNKPPLGHSRHKAHAGEDKNKHQALPMSPDTAA